MTIGYEMLGRRFTLLVRRDDGRIGEATEMDMQAAGYDKRGDTEAFRKAVVVQGVKGYMMCDKCGGRWSYAGLGEIPEPWRCVECCEAHGEIVKTPCVQHSFQTDLSPKDKAWGSCSNCGFSPLAENLCACGNGQPVKEGTDPPCCWLCLEDAKELDDRSVFE